MKKKNKFITTTFVILNIALLLIANTSLPFLNNFKIQYVTKGAAVGGTLEDQLDAINKEIEAIKSEKDSLQSQLDQNSYTISNYGNELSKLYAESQLYKTQIEELSLEIRQLELQIDSINKDIDQKKIDIAQAENTIVGLEEESSARIKDNYFNFRLYSSSDDANTVFNLTNINMFFKTSQYKELIQSESNDIMVKLAELKQFLQDKKSALDQLLVKVNKDKEVIDVKKIDLAKKREEADVNINTYLAEVSKLNDQNNFTNSKLSTVSDAESRKVAEANRIQQEILQSFVSPGNGQYVVAGTYIGKQGDTGYAFGAHLHFSTYVDGSPRDPCEFLKPGTVPNCGGGNRLISPFRGEVWYTSPYGWRSLWGGSSILHDAIDIVGTPWNSAVFATHDGYMYKGQDCYHYNLGMAASCANYVIVCENTNCNSGLKTGYWHLSEF